MAAKRDFTPYQQKVIRQYYRNEEGIRQQALADLVSDLYLATTDKKKAALWERAKTHLEGLGVPPSKVITVVEKRDLAALAELASKSFAAPDRKTEWKRDARDARSS